jgi:MFS transporter, DHA2 family, multidrug resistance protein
MISMAFAGRLLARIGAGPLIAIGFLCSAYALCEMTLWNPGISEQSIILAGIIQGVAIGLIFMPVSAAMFATLPPNLRTEAAGIFSLIRNLGSAIGISVTGVLLTRNTQSNHEQVSSVISPFNRALQSGPAATYWNPHILAGVEALNQEVTRQASFIAYIDDFKLKLVLSLAAIPLCLLLRSPRKRPRAKRRRPLGTGRKDAI